MQTFCFILPATIWLALTQLTSAIYTLQDDYSGSGFFDKFDFFTDDDPTQGYVDYISESAAVSAGLINTNNNQIHMGVDAVNVASGRGRQSVRIQSKASYNHGLIILDLEHMPVGCGTWPAFWTLGPNWPTSGEVDIIEGVNSQTTNSFALHTGPGCSISKTGTGSVFSGSVSTTECDVNAAGQPTNAGCAILSSNTTNFGAGLNSISGGVYATEWTSEFIRIWFFPRGSIPDVTNSPDPGSWGLPLAAFTNTYCDIDASFNNQQILFDTTFCGAWAGTVWAQDPTCAPKAATCQDFVQNNPTAFADAYWTINSLKVFVNDNNNNTTSSATATPTSEPISWHHWETWSEVSTTQSTTESSVFVLTMSSTTTTTETTTESSIFVESLTSTTTSTTSNSSTGWSEVLSTTTTTETPVSVLSLTSTNTTTMCTTSWTTTSEWQEWHGWHEMPDRTRGSASFPASTSFFTSTLNADLIKRYASPQLPGLGGLVPAGLIPAGIIPGGLLPGQTTAQKTGTIQSLSIQSAANGTATEQATPQETVAEQSDEQDPPDVDQREDGPSGDQGAGLAPARRLLQRHRRRARRHGLS